MKTYLIMLILFVTYLNSYCQCNVQTNQRDDGVTINYTRPDRVGFCDRFVLGLSMQTNGKDYFVATLSVFETNAEKLKGNLVLFFDNKKSSTLELYRSEITSIKGSPAAICIFVADANDLANISTSNVRMALLQLEDNTYQNVGVKINGDILKQHYSCLKKY